MPRYVAFLRAVNVGGPRTLKMDALRRIFEGLGFSDVATYIASGNVIFESQARNQTGLEEQIERGLIEALGYDATPFVRSGSEMKGIAAFRPFPRTHIGPTDELGVIFLSFSLDPATSQRLESLSPRTDEFKAHDREVYWLRHRGPGGEPYQTSGFDKLLDQPFTIRSVRTVQKIAEKYFSPR